MSIRKPLPTRKSALTEEDTLINSGLTSYNINLPKKKYSGVYGLAPKIPLSLAKEGSYTLLIELREVIKQNFKNLMLTQPGERIMDSNFGVGLMSYLFEQKDENIYSQIRDNIQRQVSIYLPYINIENIDFRTPEEDLNYLSVAIYYNIPQLNIEDTIMVTLEE